MGNSVKLLLSSLVLVVLVGCGTNKLKPEPTLPGAAQSESGKVQSVEVDKALLVNCPDIPKPLAAGEADIVTWVAKYSQIYLDCRLKDAKQSQLIKKILNIKD